jgi:hypothetical protein
MNRETIKWSPFALPKNNEDFCVLVYLVDKVYELYLFNGFIKRFTDTTLPKNLSKNLTMIKALGVPILKNERGLRELECYDMKKFVGKYTAFEDIGWRVSPNVFVLVLSNTEIDTLRGIEDN